MYTGFIISNLDTPPLLYVCTKILPNLWGYEPARGLYIFYKFVVCFVVHLLNTNKETHPSHITQPALPYNATCYNTTFCSD
jgi:hypothetical protein